MMMTAAACGSDEGSTAEGTEIERPPSRSDRHRERSGASSAFDLKGSDYVELCDYNALESLSQRI